MQIQKVCENLKHQEKDVLYLNISYPQMLSDCKAKNNFNSYYAMQAMQFRKFSVKNLYSAAVLSSNNADFNKFGSSVISTITYNTKNLISLYTDILIFDGFTTVKTRKTATWDKRTGLILRLSDIYKTSPKFKATVLNAIYRIYNENLQNNNLINIISDNEHTIRKSINLNCFCLAPMGIVFYANCEKINTGHFPAPSFLITYRELSQFDKLNLHKECDNT